MESAQRTARCNSPIEWSYTSTGTYANPFRDVDLDVVLTDPQGAQWRIPAFWAGGSKWTARFAPRLCGVHRFATLCSDAGNSGLQGHEGELDVEPYAGDNPLLTHGSLRVDASGRYMEHRDGTPFLWLADTWWGGISSRLRWPEGFRILASDRSEKGFSVIQIVIGVFGNWPAERHYDPGGPTAAYERFNTDAGLAWEENGESINPGYFDLADLRVEALVSAGMVPCILSGWGNHIHWLGVEGMKRYWRYLIARYGAYPVVWCLAGEATKQYHRSEDAEADSELQRRAWTDVAAYVREADPYHHPLTIHPRLHGSSRTEIADAGLLDMDMLQTGHDDFTSIPSTIEAMATSVKREPRVPAIDAEVCYEGWSGVNGAAIQRFMFWACMLCGAAGHTYGAEGVWQFNTREIPFQGYADPPEGGPSFYGEVPWEDAYRLPGSKQVGLGKKLLERYPWWRFEPHPDWVEPHWSAGDYLLPYAAGIPGEVRLYYFPWKTYRAWRQAGFLLAGLESGVRYRAAFFDPTNGKEYACGVVEGNAEGRKKCPYPPKRQDWVLILENRGSQPV